MMRETFVATTTALLDEDPRTALVLADISADAFEPARRRHPDRVLNVGIREQLMTGVAGGLALTGLRPYVHSYAPFVVDRIPIVRGSNSWLRISCGILCWDHYSNTTCP